MTDLLWRVSEIVGIVMVAWCVGFGFYVCLLGLVWNKKFPQMDHTDEPLFMRGECPTGQYKAIHCRSTDEVEFTDDTVIERG